MRPTRGPPRRRRGGLLGVPDGRAGNRGGGACPRPSPSARPRSAGGYGLRAGVSYSSRGLGTRRGGAGLPGGPGPPGGGGRGLLGVVDPLGPPAGARRWRAVVLVRGQVRRPVT